MKILVVDDAPLVLKFVRSLLEDEGHTVLVRESPFGTTTAVTRERPDLVLVDRKMPAMDGAELVKLIKKCPHPPAVFIYSDGSPQELYDAVEHSGADGYVQKGKPDDLVRVVRGVARRRS